MKNSLKCQETNSYTTGNLFDYLQYQNYQKFIDIDLSRKINTSISQQIDFVGKLEEDDGATMFVIAKKQQRTILNFSVDSLNVTE